MRKNTIVLRIGIASRQEMRARTVAVARGDRKLGADEPKVWFTSLESLAQVLSARNRLLLELIRRTRPASMKELAALSGRAESNLSRTLRTMERYGLVRLRKTKGRIVPEVPYERLELGLPIAARAPESERARAG